MVYLSNSKLGLRLRRRKIAWKSRGNTHCKKKQISEIQFEFPGWKQISNNRNGTWYKVVWSLIILISVCLCGYQIADRIALFASNPISTEVIVQRNDSVKFASFIVCPNIDTLEDLVYFQKKIAREKNIPYCDVTLQDVMNRFNFSFLKLWSLVNVSSLLNDPIFYEKISQATTSVEVTDFLMTFGVCRKITISELVKFRKEQFKLEISAKRGYNNCRKSAFAFSIYTRSDNDHIKYYPLTDMLNVQHYITFVYGITARQYEHLNTSKNPCSDLATVHGCRNKCIENFARNFTICKFLGMESKVEVRNCTTYSDYLHVVQLSLYSAILPDYRSDCHCPRLCAETTYKLDLKSILGLGDTAIEFHFEDNQIDLMREYYSYTIIPLLCDLGGNLGLFLGLCIPTVLENIENFVLYLKNKLF